MIKNFKMIIKSRILNRATLLSLITMLFISCSTKQNDNKENYTSYLFAYFTGNAPGQEQVHYALSQDGLSYKALNNNQPVISSEEISSSGGVRDPHILRRPDGKGFYMVLTDLYVPDMGWENVAMVMMKSDDLINWESHVVNIPEQFPYKFGQVNRVWAPQTIFDEETGKYMIYCSMRINQGVDIIYYAYANKDFTGFESAPKQLFYSPTNNACIDADIVEKDHKYYMFFKSESGKPGIKLAVSDKINEGYEQLSDERIDKEEENVEGSGIFKVIGSDEWILMYDVYLKGYYQFTKTKNLMDFEVIDHTVTMDFHPRHGCIIPITNKEMMSLSDKWETKVDSIVVCTENKEDSIQ